MMLHKAKMLLTTKPAIPVLAGGSCKEHSAHRPRRIIGVGDPRQGADDAGAHAEGDVHGAGWVALLRRRAARQQLAEPRQHPRQRRLLL